MRDGTKLQVGKAGDSTVNDDCSLSFGPQASVDGRSRSRTNEAGGPAAGKSPRQDSSGVVPASRTALHDASEASRDAALAVEATSLSDVPLDAVGGVLLSSSCHVQQQQTVSPRGPALGGNDVDCRTNEEIQIALLEEFDRLFLELEEQGYLQRQLLSSAAGDKESQLLRFSEDGLSSQHVI